MSGQYEIQYTKIADKFFCIHEDIREKYEHAIRTLMICDQAGSVDVKRIRGKRNAYYRIRLGDYRVIFTIINGKIIVVITLLAGARGDVYKKMDGLK